MTLDWGAIADEAERALASPELSVDAERLARFSREIASAELGPQRNRFPEDPIPAADGELPDLAEFPEARRLELAERGRQALESGALAVAVLNGGMATRFGGAVKGVVEAVGGHSFLAIKRAQARRAGPGPFLVMNSFATHRATLDYLEGLGQDPVESFLQGVSIRFTPSGEPFREADGSLSLHAPGHGDFPEAIRAHGRLAALRERGVRTVMLSNVDNLGAEPDPVILGYHLEHGKPLTCEVARSVPGDVGGTPAHVGGTGRLVVVEGFRFSPGFDFANLCFLSTNTFLFSTDLLEQSFALSWFYVEKEVAGRRAVQMERLVNELSSFVPSAFLATPRSGARGRFFPIKNPQDLVALRADPSLVRRFGSLLS